MPHNTRIRRPSCNIYSLISTRIPSETYTQKNPLLISPENSTNHKRLYSYIKNQIKDQSGIQQLQDKDGFIRSYSLTKANILNQHFQSVFTQNEDISTIPDKWISPHPLMQHITITPTGIHTLLCTLK